MPQPGGHGCKRMTKGRSKGKILFWARWKIMRGHLSLVQCGLPGNGPIQQSEFFEFPASRKFPYDELYIKMIHFSQNGRIRNKKWCKKWFFSRWFHGLDTGSKKEEYGNSYKENYISWASMMLIRIIHIRWIRLFSIILPYFFGLCRSRELLPR